MKKLILTTILALLFSVSNPLLANNWPEEYLGLPGDNLNLYAVMDIFRESETLESFEKTLNDPEQVINNLDLNNDKYVDYLIVKDYVDGNVHNIVLSVALNNNEYQDVAVFIVEQFTDGSVQIQLIGDEALYGKNYIIEPNYSETPNPGYKGNTSNPANVKVITTTYYQVAAWPTVRYIYQPTYVVWHSPWYYGYYPVYWSPWRPYYWHYYYGYHYNSYAHYYSYYRPWPHYRYSGYHTYYYTSLRHKSPKVTGYIKTGSYKSTYSRPQELSKGENRYKEVKATKEANARATAASNSSSASARATNNTNASVRSTPAVNNNRPVKAPVSSVRTNNNTGASKSSAVNSRSTTTKVDKPTKVSTVPVQAKNTSTVRTKSPQTVSNRSAVTPKKVTSSKSVKPVSQTTNRTGISSRGSNNSSSRVSAPSSGRSSVTPSSRAGGRTSAQATARHR